MKRSYFLLGVRPLRGIIVLAVMAASSLAFAVTISPGGQTIEDVGQAPWIFLAEVKSVEIATDSMAPSSVFPRWHAQYTRFRVIQGVKGPFFEGYEVELKECAPRDLPGHSLCGSLYTTPHPSTVGDLFLVITGPGNPNVYDYQTSIRLPANRVPAMAPFPPDSEEDFIKLEEGFARTPPSQSGWLIDLSSLSLGRNIPSGVTAPAEKAGESRNEGKSKASASVENKEEDSLPQASSRPIGLSRLMDLNNLVNYLSPAGVKIK